MQTTGNAHSHSHSYCQSNGDSYTDGHSNSNSDGHGYGYSNSNAYGYTQLHGQPESYTEISTYAAAETDTRTAPMNRAYSSRAALMIWAKLRGSRLAPPTRAPSMSGWLMSSRAFSGFTLPPY